MKTEPQTELICPQTMTCQGLQVTTIRSHISIVGKRQTRPNSLENFRKVPTIIYLDLIFLVCSNVCSSRLSQLKRPQQQLEQTLFGECLQSGQEGCLRHLATPPWLLAEVLRVTLAVLSQRQRLGLSDLYVFSISFSSSLQSCQDPPGQKNNVLQLHHPVYELLL